MAWLDSHVNLEAAAANRFGAPNLDRIRTLVRLMADPQDACPVVQITGTNGKGSTARILTSLLMENGLQVGTYTSPHLATLNERLCYDGTPICDDELTELFEAIRDLRTMVDEPPTWFELVTAAGFRWFADRAVSVAVVEVGMGGRWDATNVADAAVAVVTNVELDHVEVLGPRREDIAREKAGIITERSTLVLGETDPPLAAIFRSAEPSGVVERGRDFGCSEARVAHGGRLLDLYTPRARYEDVFLPLHGAHQGDNAACAVAAAEAFFDRPLSRGAVEEGLRAVTVPGRMEVAQRRPLCILDGAHNVAGARAVVASLREDFGIGSASVRATEPSLGGANRLAVVMGLLRGRDPYAMLAAFGDNLIGRLVACTPASPRAIPARDLAAAAQRRGLDVTTVERPADALSVALDTVDIDGAVLVTGSLYVVAEARITLSLG